MNNQMHNDKWTWPKLEKALGVIPAKFPKHPLPQLHEVENIIGHKLPDSYVYYAQFWGCGLLFGIFVVYTPHENKNLDIRVRNPKLYEKIQYGIKNGYWDQRYFDILQTMSPFGKSDNGDILCWNIANGLQKGEFPVYLLDSEYERVANVGESLLEFLGDYCLEDKLSQVFPFGGGKTWDLPLTFEPYE